MTSPSGAPAPIPGGGIKPAIAPGPAVVPPKQQPEKRRRTSLCGTLIVLAVIAAGAAYYLQSKSDSRADAGGPNFAVPTIAVSLGNVHATIRVNGTIAAQNFKALTAPRILGSRSALNRGGDGGFDRSSGRGGGMPGGGGGGNPGGGRDG